MSMEYFNVVTEVFALFLMSKFMVEIQLDMITIEQRNITM